MTMRSIGHQALANELSEARKAKGLSLRQLANQVQVDFATISHIEAGRTMPSAALTVRLAAALNLDSARLIRHRWMHALERLSRDVEPHGFVVDFRGDGSAALVQRP